MPSLSMLLESRPRRQHDRRTEAVQSLDRPSVLVVDDDVAHLRLSKLFLGGAGFEVVPAATGAEARRLLTPDCDVVLLDLHLPDVFGLDLAVDLRRRGFTGAIIVLSGYDACDVSVPVDAEISTWLSKCSSSSVVIAAIRCCLERLQHERFHRPQTRARFAQESACKDAQYRELIARYVRRLPMLVDELRHDVDAADYPSILHLAHRLSGTGGTYGFACLAATARRLHDAAARQTGIDVLRDLVDEIDDQVCKLGAQR